MNNAKVLIRAALFFSLFQFFPGDGHAQNTSKRLMGSFIVNEEVYNYEFTMEAFDSYSLAIASANRSNTQDEEESEVTDSAKSASAKLDQSINSDVRISSGTPFKEFSQEIFEGIVATEMDKFDIGTIDLNKVATEIFFKIKTRLDFINDEPITAYFILRKNDIYSFLLYNASKYYSKELSLPYKKHNIHRVEAETEDGALKNITVYLVRSEDVKANTSSPTNFIVFKNRFPISMSGKFDYEKFSNIDLFCDNCAGILGLTRFIRLMDLIIFDIVYENAKEDYSPSNRTFSISPNHPIEELRKEQRSRILEVAAFTDFIGLDRNEPNGLLQIEARKRINLNTKYRLLNRGIRNRFTDFDLTNTRFKLVDAKKKKQSVYRIYIRDTTLKADTNISAMSAIERSWVDSGFRKSVDTISIPNKKFRSPYLNFFGYIEPKLLFSKLEETNRFVDSTKALQGLIEPINLYRYQIASFGVEVQVFRMSFPQTKLQWNVLNVGMFWSRTRVALTSDSTGPTKALNSNFWEFGSSLIFRPDGRWGASLGFNYVSPRIWDNEFQIINTNGLFQDRFDAWLKTGDTGKLFFRFRRTYEKGKRNNNFTQVQLGYSLNIFAGNDQTGNNGN